MTFSPDPARTWVEVDLGALVDNARAIQATSGTRLMPMVKANGYGLGSVEVTRALETIDPWGYGVASVEEGAALRAAGISRPILVVSPLLPRDIDDYLRHDLRPTVGDPIALDAWRSRSASPFHLEIDTGMSRGGVRWDDRGGMAACAALLGPAAGWEGAFTHFHSADCDPAATEQQWTRFHDALRALPRRPPLLHAANSAAALRGSRYAADLVRPGIFLYGGAAGTIRPRTVAVLRARVVALRRIGPGDTVSYGATWTAAQPTAIATLALGYADGFPRATSELRRGEPGPRLVELHGALVPVVGRVTMDGCMVAVSPDSVGIGDVATIYGGLVPLDQQAAAAGTISYELLTSLASRVPRLYRRPA
jgi:alanine racemase